MANLTATMAIKHVDKRAHGHEHITHIGSDSQRFTRAEVIRRLEQRTDVFYVADGNDVAVGTFERLPTERRGITSCICRPWLRLVA